jgi:hypothetical protein
MDSDFRPAGKPAKSLRLALEARSAKTPTPAKTAFQTPDEVAAAEVEADLPKIDLSDEKPEAPSDGGFRHKLAQKLHFKWPFDTREYLIGAVVVVGCSVVVALVVTHIAGKPVVSATQTTHHKKLPPKPTTVASNLTGLQVDPSVNQRPVTGVMIENSLDARPQSGLSDAGVVFEAIAEGGITRFLALFQDTAPDNIGPIRSARPYYVQWAMGFDAGYAHVGGSPEALGDIKSWGVKDLDQFANGGSYHRISDRAAPHNVYTAISTLNQLETSKGYGASTYTGFVRVKKAIPAKAPTAKTIDLAISGALYNVHYDYNVATNSYNRSEGGAAHVDANGNKQISPNVVIAMIMSYGLEADDHHSQYGVIGSGQAFIFQNGTVTVGTWTKPSEKEQITFADGNGKPLALNPGQTWLTAMSAANQVSYAP